MFLQLLLQMIHYLYLYLQFQSNLWCSLKSSSSSFSLLWALNYAIECFGGARPFSYEALVIVLFLPRFLFWFYWYSSQELKAAFSNRHFHYPFTEPCLDFLAISPSFVYLFLQGLFVCPSGSFCIFLLHSLQSPISFEGRKSFPI